MLVLHHMGKAEGSKEYRGSSDIKASVDTAYSLTRLSGDAGRIDRLLLKYFKGRLAPGKDFELHFKAGTGFEVLGTCKDARTPSTHDVVEEILRERPGSNQQEIIALGQERGVGRNQIVKALESSRWVKESGKGREILYRLTQDLEEAKI